jgi:uncharacterized damage-inducible protein DinB
MSAKAKLRTKLATEFLRTQRLANIFTDAELALRPGEGSMSSAELVAHIAASRNFLRGVFAEAQPTTDLFKIPVDATSFRALRRALAESYRDVLAALDAATEEFLEGRIAPFGPDWEMSRLDMAQLMLEHEIHHRGQLSVYARVAGKVPPDLYAPVSEDVLEDSPRG